MPEIIPILGSEFVKKVVPLISAATKTIDIIVFDWRWYESDPGNPAQIFNAEIIKAARRGVVVRAVTNIAEVITILKTLKIDVRRPLTTRLIHPKIMILDHQTIVIGSHNYTQSAFTTNFELSVILKNPDCVPQFEQFFNNLFSHG
jgi:phosphatidylserine/phosphatidylglycerophosphate/cardiolipin synthase-like enzyme